MNYSIWNCFWWTSSKKVVKWRICTSLSNMLAILFLACKPFFLFYAREFLWLRWHLSRWIPRGRNPKICMLWSLTVFSLQVSSDHCWYGIHKIGRSQSQGYHERSGGNVQRCTASITWFISEELFAAKYKESFA